MKSGRTNETGQLKPLKDRLDENTLRRRQEKNEYRRTVSLEHAKTRGSIIMLAQAIRTEVKRQHYWNYANLGGWIAVACYVAYQYWY